jgi:hypothetical protein
MLESLLARVRERAAEPRQPAVTRPEFMNPPLAVQRMDTSVAAPPSLARPSDQPAVVEEEFEDYEDELVEIIDDADVVSEVVPEAHPLELSISAPSVEMRRRIVPPSSRPSPSAAALPAVDPRGPVARAVPSSPVAISEPFQAEVVARKPLSVAAVVQSHGERKGARSMPFIELLDASIKLGS